MEDIEQESIQTDGSEHKIWYEEDEIDVSNFKDLIEEMAMEYPFELDIFQKRAVYRVENSQCVLVAAHTSAGKTVVAEYAIAKSLQKLMKCVYTSPIKALSNQKYKDFREKFGDVGIMTGDVTLNEEASCLIMTTEVLQSMLYRGSDVLKDIDCVVFDEAHYLADPDRGYVWEEVIIMLPEHINIVLLSATLPNYRELADWVGRVRRKKVYIEITYFRPVPLHHYILTGKKMTIVKEADKPFDKEVVKKIFQDALERKEKAQANKRGKHLKEKKKGDKPKQNEPKAEGGKSEDVKASEGAEEKKNEEEKKDDDSDDSDDSESSESEDEENDEGQNNKPAQGVDIDTIKDQASQPEKTKLTANQKRYQKKAEKLHKKGQLKHKFGGGAKLNKSNNDLKQNINLVIEKELYPCVVFVFSKKQCNELALGCTGLDALTSKEKSKVKKFFKTAISKLDPSDRELHQIKEIEYCVENGIAYHHAGLLPILKEIVEILFGIGLIKVLFATTTFAMGLNMPARSVMFIKLQKFNGKEEAFLKSSEYLQMAGRAGRRGKDQIGYSLLYFEKAQMFAQQNIADEMQTMMNVKTGNLESQYKLTYRIILHILGKGESGFEEIQRVMKSSFLENDNYKAKISESERIKALEEKLSACTDIECIKGVPESISIYNSLLSELFNLNQQWVSAAQPKALTFPTIIEFTMDGQNYHIGTALQVDKGTKTLTVLSPDVVVKSPIEYEESKSSGDPSYYTIGFKNVTRSFANNLKSEINYMDSVRLKYSSKKDILDELEGLDRNELKEPRAKKGGAKKGGAKKGGKKTTVVSVSSSSAEPSSSGTAADSSGSKRFDIIKQLQESPCNQCSEFSEHLKQINSQNKTQKDLGKLVSNLKDEVLIKSTEFKNKIRVLKELGFITKNDTLDIKGKFAQHISSADIIILTMFIFEGGFVSLKDDEMIASLAMTMIKAGSGTEEDIHPDYLPPSFFDNKTLLEELANQVLELEDKYGVQDEQRETKSRLNLAFPLVAYEWAKKTKFAEICKISLQEAGTMITALRSLVKLCEELSDAFKEISNEETSQRFKRLSEEMRRDILFLPSLYYEKDAKVNEDD